MKEIILEHGFEIDGNKTKIVKMRPCKVGDYMLANRTSTDKAEIEVNLIANLCDIPVSAVNSIDMRDYRKLQEALTSFLS